MALSNVAGFPRIGPQRELKFATEGYWRGEVAEPELLETAKRIRLDNWRFMQGAGIDLIPSNDFSLYDQVLDAIAMVGAVPDRYAHGHGPVGLGAYFAMARGRQEGGVDVTAMEMTKWFDTNYHYIVPELGPDTSFSLSSTKPFDEHAEAMEELGIDTVPVIVGPVSFLLLGNSADGVAEGFDRLGLLEPLLEVYGEVIERLAGQGATWVQLDEPCFVEDRSERELDALRLAYEELGKVHERTRICVKTYFDHVGDAYGVLRDLPVEGIGLDFHRGGADLEGVMEREGPKNVELIANEGGLEEKWLFAGIVDGRNVWINELEHSLDLLRGLRDRCGPLEERRDARRARLGLPLFPTTTIGSFPQTAEIRQARAQLRQGEIDQAEYLRRMRSEVERTIGFQEEVGLDVLVHGEPERNDMVQYFAEQMEGYVFTQSAWVQSYGSRYVRPPILFGDVSRPSPMTTDWIAFAQSLTEKPVKGMLTGPVTMLQWSFVRDDQPRSETCEQLALAIRDEVADLEEEEIKGIQVDEPAIREGLPLRRDRWGEYLKWAVYCFRVATAVVRDETQIQTHMCYSDFGDIMEQIQQMDADVLLIEAARSRMELLHDWERTGYAQEIGPGVYDIHSPRVPPAEEMAELLQAAARVLPPEKLWVNTDCGLKTRTWPETEAALRNLVQAAEQVRKELVPARE